MVLEEAYGIVLLTSRLTTLHAKSTGPAPVFTVCQPGVQQSSED